MHDVLTDLTRHGPYRGVSLLQRVGVGRHQIQWEPVSRQAALTLARKTGSRGHGHS